MAEDTGAEEKDLGEQISGMVGDLEKHYTKVKNPNETFQEQLSRDTMVRPPGTLRSLEVQK
ncbi:MAG: hypothetical protein ACYC99_04280 [Candidatus Geothermincolia bacterium]